METAMQKLLEEVILEREKSISVEFRDALDFVINAIKTDYIEQPKQETLEEVLGTRMCKYSVIENKLAILYRNQVKIYNAITKEQDKNKYSEEDIAKAFDEGVAYETQGKLIKGKEWIKTHKKEWFEQFKNK